MADFSRRDFLQKTSIIGAGLSIRPITKLTNHVKNTSKLSVGLIGVGLRGQNHLDVLLRRNDCDVVAFADIDQRMIDAALQINNDLEGHNPTIYQNGPKDYQRMLTNEKLDLVIISTPWELHTSMAIDCMKAGVYTGMEVSGAFSIDECWELVNTHEKTGTHLMFMENVCFRRDVMAVLNMVRKDMFGELIHLEGGYQHDLRHVKFNDGNEPYGGGVEFGEKAFSEARWRTKHSVYRNGDLYPTHGIGPVAQYIDINRGNRLLSISSVASKARGLHNYIVDQAGENHPNAEVKFKLGDKVTSMIQTYNGETIVLHHDTNLPRPYSLGFRVQGTKGLWMDVNNSLHIEGVSQAHRWENTEKYFEKYDHPLWAKHAEKAVGAGHGGMDYFLINSLVETAKRNIRPVFDTYDAATWMAITPLSEQSITTGSQPMTFPDFTRGKWMDRKADFAMNDEY